MIQREVKNGVKYVKYYDFWQIKERETPGIGLFRYF